MLYLIGLGLGEKDLSLKGIEALKNSEKVLAEFYTNTNNYNLKELQDLIGKKIEILSREETESLEFLKEAKSKNISLLISGDPLTATTHFEIIFQARKNKINCEIIHNSSIFTAVAESGLSLYKFGRTTTLPKKEKFTQYPKSPYEIINSNLKNKLHSLILLDIGLNAKEALEILRQLDSKKIFRDKKIFVLCSIGTENQKIYYDFLENLEKTKFPKLPHTIIVPGELDFKEKEYLAVV